MLAPMRWPTCRLKNISRDKIIKEKNKAITGALIRVCWFEPVMIQKSHWPDFASWLNTLSIGSLEIRRRPQRAGLVSKDQKDGGGGGDS
jgi:hypothetical protein